MVEADTFPLSVHKAFTGETIVRHVHPEMPIEELLNQLQADLPAFYEAKLILGDLELAEGVCADLKELNGVHINVVFHARADLALEVIKQMTADFHPRRICLDALSFLEDKGILDDEHSHALLEYIREGEYPQNALQRSILEGTATLFGRTCNVEVFGPVIASFLREEQDIEGPYTPEFLPILIAIHEMSLRNKHAVSKNDVSTFLEYMVDRWDMIELHGDAVGLDLFHRALYAACYLAHEFASTHVLKHFRTELSTRLPDFTGDLYELVTRLLNDEACEEHALLGRACVHLT